MCSSKENPYPPHGRSLEIPRGRGAGGLKAKFLEAIYENRLEFPRGGGGGGGQNRNKKLPWRENRYFLELHNHHLLHDLSRLLCWTAVMKL